MVTPTYMLLAILAFIAMLVVIGAMIIGPDSGHFASLH
ncbi:MAG: hypothetical protein QOD69_204 [Solirubrobacteraceae bacterium]|nr:hypothetical protein [Solirubrobacteraceae bacterium]